MRTRVKDAPTNSERPALFQGRRGYVTAVDRGAPILLNVPYDKLGPSVVARERRHGWIVETVGEIADENHVHPQHYHLSDPE